MNIKFPWTIYVYIYIWKKSNATTECIIMLYMLWSSHGAHRRLFPQHRQLVERLGYWLLSVIWHRQPASRIRWHHRFYSQGNILFTFSEWFQWVRLNYWRQKWKDGIATPSAKRQCECSVWYRMNHNVSISREIALKCTPQDLNDNSSTLV